MHRFFLTKSEINADPLLLKGAEWRHCRTVLRAKKGMHITLFDGEGNEYLTDIIDIASQHAKLRLLQKSTTLRLPYSITLAQALPKNKVMDYIIQKATELGAVEIIPVFSERSVVKLDAKEITNKMSGWHETSIEAAKQCGLNWLPKISAPKTVKELVSDRKKYSLGFIASLQPDARPLWNYLNETITSTSTALLMIGPEGDFTPAEIGLARSASFQPISLGPLVLRCDTAAIYAIGTLNYEMQRRQTT